MSDRRADNVELILRADGDSGGDDLTAQGEALEDLAVSRQDFDVPGARAGDVQAVLRINDQLGAAEAGQG